MIQPVSDKRYLLALLPGLEIARDNLQREIAEIRATIEGQAPFVLNGNGHAPQPKNKHSRKPKFRGTQKELILEILRRQPVTTIQELRAGAHGVVDGANLRKVLYTVIAAGLAKRVDNGLYALTEAGNGSAAIPAEPPQIEDPDSRSPHLPWKRRNGRSNGGRGQGTQRQFILNYLSTMGPSRLKDIRNAAAAAKVGKLGVKNNTSVEIRHAMLDGHVHRTAPATYAITTAGRKIINKETMTA